MGALSGKGSNLVERIIDYMAPEDMEPEEKKGALSKGDKGPKRSHKESADLGTMLAMRPELVMALVMQQPGFGKGLTDPLPDNAVPGFAKDVQGALAAKPGGWRDRAADRIEAEPREGEAFARLLTAPFSGALRDPVRMASEVSGYAPISRAADAFSETQGAPDVPYAVGRMVRGTGEGALGAATVAGNLYGAGQAAKATGGALARAYRGGPVAELPAADSVGALRGRLAKAESAGPTQIQTMINDAGARAASAEARIKPVDWSQVDMPEPVAPVAPPQSPRDWAINIEGRTAPGRPLPRPGSDPDAYTPFEFTPEEQAAIDLSRANQGRTSMWDQPSLSPEPRRGALSPQDKAAMNAEIERLANEAEVAGQAGDAGAVVKAHEDIASIMARTGKPLEGAPELQAIRDRIAAIDRELLTEAGVWREEELLAEMAGLVDERRKLMGRAPLPGALGNSSTLGMSGGNLFDEGGPSVADSIGAFVQRLRKSAAGSQEPTFRASEPNLTFGGQGAASADAGALAKARELDAAGAPREQIWDETGWFKGPDDKWRFEIDDSGARLSDRALEKFESGKPYNTNLSGAFSHPELYKAYEDSAPFIGDYDIMKTKKGIAGTYRDGTDSIEALAPDAAEVRSITLHEGQHAVQKRENFARGGVPENMLEDELTAINTQLNESSKLLDRLRETRTQTPLSQREGIDAQIVAEEARYGYLMDRRSAEITPARQKEAYKRLAGEVEARNVQTRRDWTPEQRRETPPWMSQDVPDDQQIVTFGNGVAESRLPRVRDPNTPDLMEFDSGATGTELPPASNALGALSAPKNTAYPQEIERIAQSIEQANKAVQSQNGARLSDYILKNGGIKDDRGDVLSLIGDVRGRPGLINAKGRTLDDLALKAWEDGYFPGHADRPTVNELIDALGEDLHGRAVMPESVRDASGALDYYDTVEGVNTGLRGRDLRNHLMEKYDFGEGGPRVAESAPTQLEPLPQGWDDEFIDPFSDGPTILGSNGGNLGAEGRMRRPKSTLPTDPQIRQERLQGVRGQEPFNDDRLNAMQNKVVEMARNRYTDAEIADELELAPQTVQVYRMNARDLGIDVPQHRALSAQDDVLRLAQKGLTNQQIAERLGKNPNNVKQQIFKLRRAGLLPSSGNPARAIAGAGLVAGTTYLPARLAADFAADQQEEGALPAWMFEQAPPHKRGALSR